MKRDKEKRVHFIYTGLLLVGNKKRYIYLNTQGGKDEAYPRKLGGYGVVGNVIEVTKTEEGVESLYRYLGNVSEKLHPSYLPRIAEWSAEERANLECLKIAAEQKKDHPSSVNQLVKQLIEASRRLNAQQRSAFALWVFRQLP